MKNINIALLVGGISSERAISKISGKSMYKALLELGYNTKVYDPAYGKKQLDEVEKYFSVDDFSEISISNYIEFFNSKNLDNTDLVVLGLHGNFGEDGKIQSLLEFKGIKYTASGVLTSALGMDKAMSKAVFVHNGVKTADWFLVEENNYNLNNVLVTINKGFSYPIVVKPNDGGSTIGLTVCYSESEIDPAFAKAFEYGGKVLVEKYVKGRELTVGVLSERVLPVLEIKPKHELYDYECKYTNGMSVYEVPAKISSDIAELAQSQALKAYTSIGCKGYGRVDFLLSENNELYCLEVNTLPGMTSHSLLPKMAKYEGIEFNDLIKIIVENSLNEKK